MAIRNGKATSAARSRDAGSSAARSRAGTTRTRAGVGYRSSSRRAQSRLLRVLPVTQARWPDLEAVFRGRGCSVARGCWCMFYRRSGAPEPLKPGMRRSEVNRAALKALVDAGHSPGLIAYDGQTPVGWISLGPRSEFAKLERSPVMKPVDDEPVWSVVCFVVPAEYRNQGVARALLDAGIAYARRNGASMLEAYPVDRPGRSRDDAMWFGAKSMYDRAGFEEVARRKPTRPIVRRVVRQSTSRGRRT